MVCLCVSTFISVICQSMCWLRNDKEAVKSPLKLPFDRRVSNLGIYFVEKLPRNDRNETFWTLK